MPKAAPSHLEEPIHAFIALAARCLRLRILAVRAARRGGSAGGVCWRSDVSPGDERRRTRRCLEGPTLLLLVSLYHAARRAAPLRSPAGTTDTVPFHPGVIHSTLYLGPGTVSSGRPFG